MFLWRQRDADFTTDGSRHVALQGKHVTQVTFERLRPDDFSCDSPDQFGCDSDLVDRGDDRTFDNRVDPQFPRNRWHGLPGASVMHDRRPRDHAKSADLRQIGDELLRHPVGEVLLFRVAGEILEGKDRDGSNLAERYAASLDAIHPP